MDYLLTASSSPMRPGRPIISGYLDSTTQNANYGEVTDDEKGDKADGLQKHGLQNGLLFNNGSVHCHSVDDTRFHQTVETPNSAHKGDTTSGVPLSIVIAIGGSLLLINILIFAGLCYQRERMRKMRDISKPLPPSELDFEEARFRKMDSNRSSPCPTGLTSTGPECMSLMSGASSHKHPSPVKQHVNSHVHMPSPQPSLHSRRGQSQSRATTPMESVSCSYSPVPTHASSPVHRTHTGVSQSGDTISHRRDANFTNKVRAPSDATHKSSDGSAGGHVLGGGGVSTFSVGHHVGGSHGGTPSGTPSGSSSGVTGSVNTPVSGGAVDSAGEPVYKTINKSGQNNAVTVV